MTNRPIESLTIEAPTVKEAILQLYRTLHGQPVPDEWLTELAHKLDEEAAKDKDRGALYMMCSAEATLVIFATFAVWLPVVESNWWINETSEGGARILLIALYRGEIKPFRSSHNVWQRR